MLRYIFLIGLLLIFVVACASPGTQSQPTTAEETHEDDHASEEEHDDDREDQHDAGQGRREHEVHEHGAAELMIAWSGNDLAIDLQTPAYNVLGFEYAPTTEAEQILLAEIVAALEAGELLQFSPDASCTLTSATVKTELTEEGEERPEAEEAEETHSDIDASYNIHCQQPDKLETLDMSKLFAQFPNFEDLRAQWVSDVEQSAKNLTADDPVLSFK